ncbi:MAG: nucleotide exchange factor GrpE [Candidatus Omnitrophica bacterium]|nr:nucleotide exchange factor GrpE [Candidatus Omnitrophota bacterium]MBU1924333.1 nucleotide exchange factor GrpE [Candidatus Omnitrophota bacterium]
MKKHSADRDKKEDGMENDATQEALSQGQDSPARTIEIPEKEYLELKGKEKEACDSNERILRLQADFDNIRKRMERDRIEFLKFADEEVMSELIPFVDDFQRAFSAADNTKDFNVLHRGVEMILNHLLELLKKKGVCAIEAVGKKFDPKYHEAVLQVESDEYPENTVIEQMQKGYLYNDRVLRTAKVKVSKPKEEMFGSEAESPDKESDLLE